MNLDYSPYLDSICSPMEQLAAKSHLYWRSVRTQESRNSHSSIRRHLRCTLDTRGGVHLGHGCNVLDMPLTMHAFQPSTLHVPSPNILYQSCTLAQVLV